MTILKRNDRYCKMGLDLDYLMTQALIEGEKGLREGEVPVGAVIADPEGNLIASAHNLPISLNDPTAHAEILVLRAAGEVCKNYRLTGTTLVVTVEPCAMCMGAALHARVSRLVFGVFDPKGGAAGSVYAIHEESRLNHNIDVVSGIMKEECRKLMQGFFKDLREKRAK